MIQSNHGQSGIAERGADPRPRRTDSSWTRTRSHAVQLYEEESFLFETIAEFAREGLSAGERVLIISARAGSRELAGKLSSVGIELGGPELQGRFRLVDGRALLSRIMNGDLPDAARFRRSVGALLGDPGMDADSPPLRLFGDMVDVLCLEGNVEAAMRLEDLWNELLAQRPFTLLCAYSMDSFERQADAGAFLHLCGQHARVLPAEGWARLTAEARAREVSRLQQQTRAMETELAAASRMKDEFLAVLSHELRTPLSAILGWVSVVNELPRDQAPIGRALDAIQRNAHHQLRLIQDLLDVSRIVTGNMRVRMEPIDLRATLEQALASVEAAAEAKSIGLACRLTDTLPSVSGDPKRLQQVIWNLLSNAIKFTPVGGRVDVAMEADESAIRIAVRDTGQGIESEFLPYVFDRFRQADGGHTRSHNGLGLGLAVARHLVEAHGGTLTAESPGRGLGSTFTVRLPRVHRAATPAPGAGA